MRFIIIISALLLFSSCSKSSESARVKGEWSKLFSQASGDKPVLESGSSPSGSGNQQTLRYKSSSPRASQSIFKNSKQLREDIVHFSRQYMGTPYLYGSMDPETGFDCSGFINYVFNRFRYNVPRSSKDFMNYGRQVHISKVQKGDLLIFAGSEPNSMEVGHIGMVLSPNGMNSQFIHSSSGKANGVTVSSLAEPHYAKRLVKAISVMD